MAYKHFLGLLILFATAVSAQTKELNFSSFQASTPDMHWKKEQKVSSRKARFSDTRIALSLNKLYNLTISSKKNLLDGGIVYRCKDQNANEVTITLISDERMFLYSGKDRFQVVFDQPVVSSVQNSLADSD